MPTTWPPPATAVTGSTCGLHPEKPPSRCCRRDPSPSLLRPPVLRRHPRPPCFVAGAPAVLQAHGAPGPLPPRLSGVGMAVSPGVASERVLAGCGVPIFTSLWLVLARSPLKGAPSGEGKCALLSPRRLLWAGGGNAGVSRALFRGSYSCWQRSMVLSRQRRLNKASSHRNTPHKAIFWSANRSVTRGPQERHCVSPGATAQRPLMGPRRDCTECGDHNEDCVFVCTARGSATLL